MQKERVNFDFVGRFGGSLTLDDLPTAQAELEGLVAVVASIKLLSRLEGAEIVDCHLVAGSSRAIRGAVCARTLLRRKRGEMKLDVI